MLPFSNIPFFLFDNLGDFPCKTKADCSQHKIYIAECIFGLTAILNPYNIHFENNYVTSKHIVLFVCNNVHDNVSAFIIYFKVYLYSMD